jgi:hypothetical protein
MEVATMYDLEKREQAALTLRREVEKQLSCSLESMQYTYELTRTAQDVMSDISLLAQQKLLATLSISDILLKGAIEQGALPDCQQAILASRQRYLATIGYSEELALQGVLVDLHHAITEGLPEEPTNPIRRLLQGR